MAASESENVGHARGKIDPARSIACALASAIHRVILSAAKRSRRIPRSYRSAAPRDSSTPFGMTKHMYRTHHCNSLRKIDIGKHVTLAGWVNVTRDHGGVIFIDLRNREGLTQVVFRPEENAELAKQSHSLRSEDVIQVSGRVAARVPGTENPKLA